MKFAMLMLLCLSACAAGTGTGYEAEPDAAVAEEALNGLPIVCQNQITNISHTCSVVDSDGSNTDAVGRCTITSSGGQVQVRANMVRGTQGTTQFYDLSGSGKCVFISSAWIELLCQNAYTGAYTKKSYSFPGYEGWYAPGDGRQDIAYSCDGIGSAEISLTFRAVLGAWAPLK